jgi:ATP-dependent RNA helicase DeaD
MTPTTSSAANQAFAGLGLGPEVPPTLTSLGFQEPTPIQAAALPHLLGGRDLLGPSATETAKLGAMHQSRLESPATPFTNNVLTSGGFS